MGFQFSPKPSLVRKLLTCGGGKSGRYATLSTTHFILQCAHSQTVLGKSEGRPTRTCGRKQIQKEVYIPHSRHPTQRRKCILRKRHRSVQHTIEKNTTQRTQSATYRISTRTVFSVVTLAYQVRGYKRQQVMPQHRKNRETGKRLLLYHRKHPPKLTRISEYNTNTDGLVIFVSNERCKDVNLAPFVWTRRTALDKPSSQKM